MKKISFSETGKKFAVYATVLAALLSISNNISSQTTNRPDKLKLGKPSALNTNELNIIEFGTVGDYQILHKNKGEFGKPTLALHCHQNDALGFYSTGWTPLFEVKGGTGDAFLKGGLHIRKFNDLKANVLNILEFGHAGDYQLLHKNKGEFGKPTMALHCHQDHALGFYSTGWAPLLEVKGGTGDAFLKGGLHIRKFNDLKANVLNILEFGHAGDYQLLHKNKGAFGKPTMALHCHQDHALGFYSTGWAPLLEVKGGTGDAFLKGGLHIRKFNDLKANVLNILEFGHAGDYQLLHKNKGAFGKPTMALHCHQDHALGFYSTGWAPLFEVKGGTGDTYIKGKVGIGTANSGKYKLAVEGTIGTREIEVKQGSWADFVFYEDYELKDLNEVESFINENKHLPDVPSEKEVREEGINLGQMDAVLLQKIEELTLYLIEQNKSLAEQNERQKVQNEKQNDLINTIQSQQAEIENLKKEISSLKK